jgi:hypothetical protein
MKEHKNKQKLILPSANKHITINLQQIFISNATEYQQRHICT